jgi:hypothetical protein
MKACGVAAIGIVCAARLLAAQGSPDRPTATRREEWLTIDLAGQRTAIEYDAPRHDGSARWRRFAYGSADRTVVDLVNRFASTRPDPNARRVRADFARRVPHLLLLEASRSPERLRDLDDIAAQLAPPGSVLEVAPGVHLIHALAGVHVDVRGVP